MAVLRANIQKTVIATGITFGTNVVFAHGLGVEPDAVFIRFREALTPNPTNWYGIVAVCDVDNVTLQNMGDVISPTMEVCAVRFHSIIQ